MLVGLVGFAATPAAAQFGGLKKLEKAAKEVVEGDSANADAIAKELKNKINKSKSRMSGMQFDKAAALFKEATDLLARLKAEDADHKDLAGLQKKYDKLRADLEKKITQKAGRAINPMKSSVEKALGGDDREKLERERGKLADAMAKYAEMLNVAGGSSGASLLAGAQGLLDEADAELGVAPVDKPKPAAAKPAASGGATSGEDPKVIYKEIQSKFRGSGRAENTPELVALVEEIRGLIDRLRAADPNHKKLAEFEKKADKLVVDAYAGDVQKARRQIDRYVSRIEMYLERNKEEEREDIKRQRTGLGEALEEHRASLMAAGDEGKQLIDETEATMRKVDERFGAALAGDAAAEEWVTRLRQFTRDGDKDLTRSINSDDDEAKLKQDRAEAEKVWETYQATTLSGGKTSDLDRAEEFFKQATKEADRKFKFAEGKRQQEARERERQSTGTTGKIVFSAKPIDPTKPVAPTTEFKTSDRIYSLIQMDKKWTELFGKKTDDGMEVAVPIEMMIDGKSEVFQYIQIKKPEAQTGTVLVLDIAPDPAKMVAYKDPGFKYAGAKEHRKIGPDSFTYILSNLASGKHTVRMQISRFNDYFVVGDFTIEGDDYKSYGKLREGILAEVKKFAVMPEAQKDDKALEGKMKALLANAGWTDVRRLVIVDKDWWLNYVSGSNSSIASRHIAAAVAAKGADGKCYWCNVTFHQQKLITGAFGELEIRNTGLKNPIEENNIGR